MQVPLFHDLVWAAAPVVWACLVVIVAVGERRAMQSGKRIGLWVAAQFIFPFTGFIGWLLYRWYEHKMHLATANE